MSHGNIDLNNKEMGNSRLWDILRETGLDFSKKCQYYDKEQKGRELFQMRVS